MSRTEFGDWLPFDGHGTINKDFIDGGLSLKRNERVYISGFSDKGWMRATTKNGQKGIVNARNIQLDGEEEPTPPPPLLPLPVALVTKSLTTRDAVRDKLLSRISILDANRNERDNGDEDVNFEQWQEKTALGWLGDNKEAGRVFEEESVYIFIDSSARDRSVFPKSGEFKVTLNEEVNNVIRAEIIQASIPLIDKNVNTTNRIIRYSFAPYNSVISISIPMGAYLGAALALEIQTQMNMQWHAALLGGGVNFMNYTTGFVVTILGAREPAISQFRVLFNISLRTMSFQVTDAVDTPDVATPFALHMKRSPTLSSISYTRTDDIYDVIGFERQVYIDNGTYDAGSDTYYITSANGTTAFGPGADVDTRFSYSLRSNQAVDLRGNLAIMVDISPFNDNDFALINDSGNGSQSMHPYFAIILTRPSAFVSESIIDINNNNFPMHRYFREGKERIKDLSVALRRPDGSVIDFGNLDFFLTLRLTVKRAQQHKPLFAR